ncbi:MAG TPA: serine/threonine-protein kinase [Ktedonobacteraceae bacterium]
MIERNGQQLGNYRLVKRLGRGGAAEVYLGEHVFLNTQAAIKLLQAPLSEQDTPAFLREARTIAGLAHPHIVRVLDFGVQEETFYLVMEYAPQGTLRQRYPPGARVSQETVAELVRQIADALQYAHNKNIIHCDVKPENVLLGKDGTLLLSDFGISTVLQTMTAQDAQQIVGTIAYMAPEQFEGKPQQASDQYALAVIAYEWLSGERPFQGSMAAISSQHLHAQAAPLNGRVPGILPVVDAVLSIALAKEPARRFSSIQAFARALEQACGGRAAQASMDLSDEGPTMEATMLPAPEPLPTPRELVSPERSVDVTVASDHYQHASQRNTDPSQLPSGYANQLQSEPIFAPMRRVPNRTITRRVLLAGAGGVVLVGTTITLAASGKLSALFASGHAASTISTNTPRGRATPRSTNGQTPDQATPTPNNPLGSTLMIYTGQSSEVTGVCWSPVTSSRLVASCSQDKSVVIWNAAAGSPVLPFTQSAPISVVVWSPDGQYLAFGGDNTEIEIHNVQDGSMVARLTGHSQPVRGLAWSPDSRRLVSASEDHTAIVWDVLNNTQQQVFTGHTNIVWAAAWAPNGHAVATAGWDNRVQIWNPDDGLLMKSFTTSMEMRAVDWSPDSTMLAFGGDDSLVQVRQASSGQTLATYHGHSNHIESVQWSPNGQRIASASKDGTAQIWQASDASPFYTYRGHTKIVWALAWSPDGQFIATGSGDATTHIWQAV